MDLRDHIRRATRPSATVLGVLVLAVTLAIPAPAGAGSAAVTVTAEIASVFSLTLLTDGRIDFGSVTVGAVYQSPEQQSVRVSSSRPWNFTDSSDANILLGSVVVPRGQIVRHTVDPGFGTGIAPGVYDIACSYTLDLTSAEARALTPGTHVSTSMGYTAVQQ